MCPRIEALINVTQGATWFSTHDLSSGYWQTPMSTLDGSDLKTAFVTKDGTFCWKVMPFGLRNSGATMQRPVDETLGPLLWETVAAYVDDAVVFTRGETEEKAFAQHLLDLRAFYTRIRKAGLHLKPTKCRLGRRRVQLLGHMVDGDIRTPTAANTEAVRAYAIPTTRKQLHTFLGLSSYFREYVDYFSNAAAPLCDLLRDTVSVKRAWTPQHTAAFKEIKRLLVSAPFLQLPRYGPDAGQFVIQTDTSGRGTGAVLMQLPSKSSQPGTLPQPVAQILLRAMALRGLDDRGRCRARRRAGLEGGS